MTKSSLQDKEAKPLYASGYCFHRFRD